MRFFLSALNNNGFYEPPPVLEYKKVFLMTGQSNMAGYCNNSKATTEELAQSERVKIWNPDTNIFEWLSIIDDNNVSNEKTYATHGMELGMNKYIDDYFPNDDIFLIKKGLGGSRITEHLSSGSVYLDFYNNYVSPAIANLINQKFNLEIYMVWFQGEADAAHENYYNEYASNFASWLTLWRGHFGNDLPITICELKSESNGGYPYNDELNIFFNNQADTDDNINIVNTTDLTHISIHFDYDEMKVIGERVLYNLSNESGAVDTEAPDTPTLIEVT